MLFYLFLQKIKMQLWNKRKHYFQGPVLRAIRWGREVDLS